MFRASPRTAAPSTWQPLRARKVIRRISPLRESASASEGEANVTGSTRASALLLGRSGTRMRAVTSPRKRPGPTPVGTLLMSSPKLRPRSDRIDRERWRSLVGDRIGERTRPGTVHDGCLTVYVATAVWAQELTLLSTTILERLAGSGVRVERLRFRVGDVGEPPAPRPVKERPAPPKADLPDALRERLARIDDPVLRAAIAEAAAYSLGRENGATSARTAIRDPRSGGRRSDPQAPSPPPRTGGRGGTGGKRSR